MIFFHVAGWNDFVRECAEKSKLQKKEFLEKMSQAGFHLPGKFRN